MILTKQEDLVLNQVYNMDCIEGMKYIKDKSVNMILSDLPYGTTRSSWDCVIPFAQLWEAYERIIKPNGAIVLTASQPFAAFLLASNPKLYKYSWIWEKSRGSNFVHSKYQPLKVHEEILVFSKMPAAQNSKKINMAYNPIKTQGKPYDKGMVQNDSKILDGEHKFFEGKNETGERMPRSVLYFSSDSDGKERGLHPTQKPVALFEYLIKTYTQEGEIVLDNCMGSGTTAIACLHLKRNYIGFENDKKHGYYNNLINRIEKHK